ncbi:MAG: outer membrane protein assembly factor BamE [Gammaproteobacteria bacterium]|nr:outer membrane protein assembly factor BamE [Gammaproteobacteria bacterium]
MRILNYSASILFCIFLFPALTACTIHRIDIQQGTVMEQENLDRLKTGMTKEQVIFLLGDAPIQDPFHPDRWDYIYSLKSSTEGTTSKHIILLFDGDKLSAIRKDDTRGAEGETR